ncbi:MAG: hypothetical protein Q8N15_01030, partial [Bacillota bacterium]|nr:hypothetical protein [Bacillota bacterium]
SIMNLEVICIKPVLEDFIVRVQGEAKTLHFADDGSIVMTLPDPKSKELGLIRGLEACTDIRPIQSAFSILRQVHYADVGEGPRTFFEAFEKISG